MSASKRRPRCVCGATMRRDFQAESKVAVTDPDFTGWDVDRYQELAAAGKEVHAPVLSRSLAGVEGVPQIRGRNGRQYGMFRNKADRLRHFKRMGLVDLDT